MEKSVCGPIWIHIYGIYTHVSLDLDQQLPADDEGSFNASTFDFITGKWFSRQIRSSAKAQPLISGAGIRERCGNRSLMIII